MMAVPSCTFLPGLAGLQPFLVVWTALPHVTPTSVVVLRGGCSTNCAAAVTDPHHLFLLPSLPTHTLPPQVELFTGQAAFKSILDALTGSQAGYRLTAVHLVDAHLATEPSKWVTGHVRRACVGVVGFCKCTSLSRRIALM